MTEYIKEKNKGWENEKGSRKRKEYEEITMNIKKDLLKEYNKKRDSLCNCKC